MQAIKDPDHYITLHHAQFKTPIEVLRKNFKNLQKMIDKQNKQLHELLKIGNIKEMIQSHETFVKKMRIRVKQHNEHVEKLKLRIERMENIQQLWIKYGKLTTSQLNDQGLPLEVARFYRMETNLMMVEYLINQSMENFNLNVNIAKKLGVYEFIDIDVILQGLKIKDQIINEQNPKLLKLWCMENRKKLKNLRDECRDREGFLKNDIEFECDLQEFLQLMNEEKIDKAFEYAQKNLKHFQLEEQVDKIARSGSIAWAKEIKKNILQIERQIGYHYGSRREGSGSQIPQNVLRKYITLVSSQRWGTLGKQFISNFKALYGMNETPLFLTMLNVGGSTMKTKACKFPQLGCDFDSKPTFDNLVSGGSDEEGNLKHYYRSCHCPICSKILKQVLDPLPYALQTRSNLYDDAVILMNDHVYSFRELMYYNRHEEGEQEQERDGLLLDIVSPTGEMRFLPFDKLRVEYAEYIRRPERLVVDPVTLEKMPLSVVEKVYPS